jgi:hypothetical protein
MLCQVNKYLRRRRRFFILNLNLEKEGKNIYKKENKNEILFIGRQLSRCCDSRQLRQSRTATTTTTSK